MSFGESRARNSFFKACQTIHDQNFPGKDGAQIYRLLHIYSPDHSSENATVVFASDYDREIYLEGLEIEQRNLLKYNRALDA